DAQNDLALGDAVAAANLGIVRERRNGRLRVRRAASRGEGLAEDQQVAKLRNILLLLEQVEIPAAVGGIAIQHRADDAVVPDDYALVDAAARVAQHDILAPVAARKIASGEDIDPRHLELGRGHRSAIAARSLDQ